MAKNEVVKSNDLIMAKYSLGLNEQKLAFTLISRINNYKEEYIFEDVEISLDEYAELINKKDYRKIDIKREVIENCKNLLRAIVEVKAETEKGIEWVGMSWFDRIKVSSEKNKVSATFGYEIRPYLYNLCENFTRYSIKNISNFNCIYSSRIYELVKQYEKIGSRTISVEELKEYLLISDKYPQYSNLKIKVIEPAIEEINKYTDVKITYKEVKKSRKVAEIEFKIKENKKNIEKQNDLNNKTIYELVDIIGFELIEKYKTYIKAEWKNKIINKIDKRAIIELVEELKNDVYKKRSIKNIVAYFEGVLIKKHEEYTGIKIKKIDMIEKVEL